MLLLKSLMDESPISMWWSKKEGSNEPRALLPARRIYVKTPKTPDRATVTVTLAARGKQVEKLIHAQNLLIKR